MEAIIDHNIGIFIMMFLLVMWVDSQRNHRDE
jgi:hypothetical protein